MQFPCYVYPQYLVVPARSDEIINVVFCLRTCVCSQQQTSIFLWVFVILQLLCCRRYTAIQRGDCTVLEWGQVDDALYDVVSMMSGHFMVFVELPMGKSAEEMTAYSITLKKMQVVSQFWQTQDLGVDVTVPGLGHLTLNLAALVSVVLASAGAVWVFSKQVRCKIE